MNRGMSYLRQISKCCWHFLWPFHVQGDKGNVQHSGLGTPYRHELTFLRVYMGDPNFEKYLCEGAPEIALQNVYWGCVQALEIATKYRLSRRMVTKNAP